MINIELLQPQLIRGLAHSRTPANLLRTPSQRASYLDIIAQATLLNLNLLSRHYLLHRLGLAHDPPMLKTTATSIMTMSPRSRAHLRQLVIKMAPVNKVSL